MGPVPAHKLDDLQRNVLRNLRCAVTFLHGERTADRIQPGGFAVTEIESGGDLVFCSRIWTRTESGKDELIYSSGDLGGHTRGFLEVHLTNEGTQLVNGVYSNVLLDILGWTRHVSPSGRMNVMSAGSR